MEILQIREGTDRQGNPRIFCHVLFDHGTYGKCPFGCWLTPGEYATYMADNDSITSIMESYRQTAKILRMQELEETNIHLEE